MSALVARLGRRTTHEAEEDFHPRSPEQSPASRASQKREQGMLPASMAWMRWWSGRAAGRGA